MEQVFVFLQQFTPIPETVRATIASLLFPAQFGKDEYLVEEGTVNRDLFFLTRGIVNCFFLDKKGLKKTTLILKEGDLIAFAESYYTRTLNYYNVQALEPVEALRISYDAIEQICREHPLFERIVRMIAFHYNFLLSHHIRDSKIKTAQERYRAMLRDAPELILRAPGHVLASYLNATRYHFSRIRRGIR